MCLGGGAENSPVVAVSEQVSQRGPQGIGTALIESYAIARKDICALWDIARHAAAAVGHGLQQAHAENLIRVQVHKSVAGMIINVHLLVGQLRDQAAAVQQARVGQAAGQLIAQ